VKSTPADAGLAAGQAGSREGGNIHPLFLVIAILVAVIAFGEDPLFTPSLPPMICALFRASPAAAGNRGGCRPALNASTCMAHSQECLG
jgi:hypothetical protein